jgi:hypothetical protein
VIVTFQVGTLFAVAVVVVAGDHVNSEVHSKSTASQITGTSTDFHIPLP